MNQYISDARGTACNTHTQRNTAIDQAPYLTKEIKPPTLSEIQQQCLSLLGELNGTIKNFADRLEPILLPRQDVPTPTGPEEVERNISSLTGFQLSLLRDLRSNINQLNYIHSRINL